ncbi:DUF2829 domain-containing protein [Nonomuraea sp. NPDC059023]|uniref:DUF2829 domain-containing protein n=1 Tax=unclassified Nonomuraea TaxID=2593643 RepID=UPI00367C7C22
MTGPHGHVVPRPDGNKARCGGPRMCRVCAAELAAKQDSERELTRTLAAAWTQDVPDYLIGVVRLSCGHAKLWQRNIGIPGPASCTMCFACDDEVRGSYEIPRPAPTGQTLNEGTLMTFGDALAHLKLGSRLTRDGWNGQGMWIFVVPGSTFRPEPDRPLGKAAPELVGQPVTYRPHIDMRTVDGQIVPWVASQSDLLADDWRIVL